MLWRRRERVEKLPEITSFETYAGTAGAVQFQWPGAPLLYAQSPEMGDLQVNLTPRTSAARSSHDIALEIRKRLKGIEMPAA